MEHTLATTEIDLTEAASVACNDCEVAPATRLAHKQASNPPLLALSVGSVLVLLAAWWAITAAGWIDPVFLPTPQAVAHKAWVVSTQGFMDATLWQHLSASLTRIVLALVAAVLVAVPVGLAMGLSARTRAVLDPLIEFYRPIPPLAYLPLIVIWCGIGEFSKVLLIYLAIFAPVAIATASGVRHVDPARLRAAQALGASRWQIILYVVFAQCLARYAYWHPHWSGRRLVYPGCG